MCAHYVGLTAEQVEQAIRELTTPKTADGDAATQLELDLPPSGVDVFPKSTAPVIVPDFDTAVGVPELAPGMLTAQPLQWGFTPTWTKDVVFNTRIESADKPMWRSAMEHGRCLVVCRWFYETHRTETTVSERTGRPIKQRYAFRVPGAPVMLIGCVRRGAEFSMVTTDANADMAPVHPRMPLIVRPDEADLWLGPGYPALADRSGIRLDSLKVA